MTGLLYRATVIGTLDCIVAVFDALSRSLLCFDELILYLLVSIKTHLKLSVKELCIGVILLTQLRVAGFLKVPVNDSC